MSDSTIQTSFGGGELSPALYARVDLAKFEVGAALLQNFFVDYRGGAANRAGTEFIADVSDLALSSLLIPRLIPFIVSTDASYELIFSDLLVSIYSNKVFVTSVVVPYTIADVWLLKYTQSADVMTIAHPSYPPANLSRTSDTTFSYAVIDVGPAVEPPILTTMRAPHSGPYNFSYVITTVDIDGKEESLPSNIGVKHSEGMNELTNRVVGFTWDAPDGAISRYNVYKWGPIDAVTMTPATVWGFIGSAQTTTFSDNNIAPDFSKQPPQWGDPFSGGQIQTITVTSGGSGYDGVSGDWPVIPFVPLDITGDGTDAAGWAVIDHASGTIVGAFLTNAGKNYSTVTVTADGESGTGATFDVVLSPLAPLYPACVSYVQQRRVYGALGDTKPDTVVMSQPGLFDNFCTTPVALDTDAVGASIASLQVNTIKSLVPVSYGLLAFTTGGSYIVGSSDGPQGVITPATVSVTQQSSIGANDLPPQLINYDILFGASKGNRIMRAGFAWERQSYTTADITQLAPHLFDGYTVRDWGYADTPFKLLWVVRSDGVLLSCTYVPEQDVYAWARHNTQGYVISLCVVPEGAQDAVYVIVKRYVPAVGGDGACEGFVYYLERIHEREGDCLEHGWFLDAGLKRALNSGYARLAFDAPEGDTTMTLCGGCDVQGVYFDGTTVLVNEALAATDNSYVSFSFWFRYDFGPGPGEYYWWAANQAGDTNFLYASGGESLNSIPAKQANFSNATVTQSIFCNSNDAMAINSEWHHLLCSVSLAGTGEGKLLIDGFDSGMTFTPSGTSDGIFGWNGKDFHIGGNRVDVLNPWPGTYLAGDLAQFWFAPGQSLLVDGDIPAETIAKFFVEGGCPVDLGADGSTPTGTAPAIFLNCVVGDDPTTFLTNRGTGGDFTVGVGDGLRRSLTNPPDAGPTLTFPVIVGETPAGSELSVDLTSWPREVLSATYTWRSDPTNTILGTSSTYTTLVGDVGKRIYCDLYVTDALGVWPVPTNGDGVFFGPVT